MDSRFRSKESKKVMKLGDHEWFLTAIYSPCKVPTQSSKIRYRSYIECLGLSLKEKPVQGELPGSTPWSCDGSKPSWKSMFLGRWWFSFSKSTWKLKCWLKNLPPFRRVKLDRWFRFLERHPFQNSKMCSTLGEDGRGRVEWFRFQVCGYPTEDYFAVQCQWRHPMLWGIRKSRWMCGEWMR